MPFHRLSIQLLISATALLTAATSFSQTETLAWAPVQASTQAPQQSADARVEAVRDATLAAQVTGSIVQLAVHAGDHVKAGQVLLRIDARMASQGAAASNAQVAAAQAQTAVAAKEYERQEQLFARHYISQAALDNAKAQWQASQAQMKALQAQAGVAATQSGLHVLQAPFDGVVASVPVTQGDMALPGKPLINLYDPQNLRVSAALTQEQMAQLRAGAQVSVELPGAAQRTNLGMDQVHILPTADAQSHTGTVRVSLPADTPKAIPEAIPGAFARLWFGGARTPHAATRLFVPVGAVVQRAELTAVYVLGSNGKPQLRQVRLGQRAGAEIEILSGVSAGEQVAANPQAAARVR